MADGVKPPYAHQTATMGGLRGGKSQMSKSLVDALKAAGVKVPQFTHMDREQAESRIHRHAGDPEISHLFIDESSHLSQHAVDAARYYASTQVKPPKPDIKNVADAEMVMEMIRRGYAVMKLPEDGGPPESLR